jgi:hypothetical protein
MALHRNMVSIPESLRLKRFLLVLLNSVLAVLNSEPSQIRVYMPGTR